MTSFTTETLDLVNSSILPTSPESSPSITMPGSDLFPDVKNNTRTCSIKFNQSDPFHIGDKYGGIPLNLLTNTIGWSVLIVLFVFIRKNSVQKVGRRLATSTVDTLTGQWQHVFFGRDNEPAVQPSDNDFNELPYPEDHGHENGHACDVQEVLCKDEGDKVIVDNVNDDDSIHSCPVDNKRFLTFKEKQLLGIMGPDAVQYLRFQKYIMIYIFITTIVSIGVILPLNFQGTQLGNATDFGHTTLANLNPNDDEDSFILWIHVIVAFLLFPSAIFLMRRFSIGLKMRDTSLKITRTVAIEKIPKHLCNIGSLKQHFAEIYPEFAIHDIQVAYNVSKLTESCLKLQDVIDCKRFSERYRTRVETDLEMIPVSGARCCGCFCWPCVKRVNCVDFFTEEEDRLRKKVKQRGQASLQSNLGIAFVTFKNINHARHFLRDHKNSILHLKHNPPESSLPMKSNKWGVWYAPPPNDIIWENLSDKREWTTVKKIIANLFIFVVAFFLTTPQFIVHQLDPILNALKNFTAQDNFGPSSPHSEEFVGGNSSETPSNGSQILNNFSYLPALMTDFLPTLMIWSFTAALPVVVAYADRLVGHWTRSGENHAIMKKTFWYLLFMVVILPTFGFTSTQAYIDFLIKESSLNWECIFLPDSGAFFVNYVITAAMIGTALELIRFPELFWYLVQICCSRSKADNPAVRKAIKYEFRFGEQYARMMLIFAMVVMFSISCPLITPFGCIYFILKHLVDRHNLAFVYARSKISKKVHATAINFVIMSVALLQFFMIVFSVIRSLDSNFQALNMRTKVAIGLFVLTLNVCSAQIWSNTCRKISPIKYLDVLLGEDMDDEHNEEYLPRVLKQYLCAEERGGNLRKDYNTFE